MQRLTNTRIVPRDESPIEVFADGADLILIEAPEDYSDPSLPQSVKDLIAARALPPPIVYAPLSPRQFWQALTAAGLRPAVEVIRASLRAKLQADPPTATADDYNLFDWIEKASEFERSNPVLAGMAQQLGKTDADIDALFALGATL